MNYKVIIITMMVLALCMCLPVSAVWMNGNWVSEQDAATAVYDPVTGVSSKIVPTDTSIPTDGCGELNIQTLTHNALIGADFTIERVDATNHTFVNGNRVAKEVADSYTNESDVINRVLDHNGRYNDRVIPGVYRITLLDGNGAQPEYAIVEATEGQKADVVFQGHGVSMGDENTVCLPKYTIIDAEYCGTTVPAVTHVVHHPAVEGHVAYYTVEEATWITEVSHTEYRYKQYGQWSQWNINKPSNWNSISNNNKETKTVIDSQGHWNGNCDEVYGYGHYDFKVGNQKYEFETNGDDFYTFHAAVTPVRGWDETVIDTPAVLGGCANVKTNVQTVVDNGVFKFVFDNTKQGLYDANGKLVSPIIDPAVNIVKHISMVYNKGCGATDIKAEFEEYELFDITTGLTSKSPA
jgi:hypothetical protein